MEGSYSQPFDHDQTPSGASKFLFNLPSRGHLSSTVISSNLGGMRVYICEHNSSPPESQHIKTNQQNILIRSLMLNNKKGDSSSKDVKAAAEGPRKRAAERIMDSRASAKKPSIQSSSRSGLLKESWIAGLQQRKPVYKVVLDQRDQAVMQLRRTTIV